MSREIVSMFSGYTEASAHVYTILRSLWLQAWPKCPRMRKAEGVHDCTERCVDCTTHLVTCMHAVPRYVINKWHWSAVQLQHQGSIIHMPFLWPPDDWLTAYIPCMQGDCFWKCRVQHWWKLWIDLLCATSPATQLDCVDFILAPSQRAVVVHIPAYMQAFVKCQTGCPM